MNLSVVWFLFNIFSCFCVIQVQFLVIHYCSKRFLKHPIDITASSSGLGLRSVDCED
jgi:hypothetical protein